MVITKQDIDFTHRDDFLNVVDLLKQQIDIQTLRYLKKLESLNNNESITQLIAYKEFGCVLDEAISNLKYTFEESLEEINE